MSGPHCLICGAPIVSGLYCNDCKWEMRRIRLKTDYDLDSWISESMEETKRVRACECVRPLDSFSSQ